VMMGVGQEAPDFIHSRKVLRLLILFAECAKGFTCPPQWGLRSVCRLPRSAEGKAGGTRCRTGGCSLSLWSNATQ
jgi:hypothetical protein